MYTGDHDMIKVSTTHIFRQQGRRRGISLPRLARLFVELVVIHFIFRKPFSKLQLKIKNKNK